MEASFFSKPLSQLECRDNKKSCHLLEKKGTRPVRMHDNNTTCNRSNQNARLPDTHSIQPISIQPLQTQQKPRVTKARHNAEKHSLFFFSELVREFGSFILIADGDKHETVWNIVSFSFKIITVNKLVYPEALYWNLCN